VEEGEGGRLLSLSVMSVEHGGVFKSTRQVDHQVHRCGGPFFLSYVFVSKFGDIFKTVCEIFCASNLSLKLCVPFLGGV
jgi:hypothetical protein